MQHASATQIGIDAARVFQQPIHGAPTTCLVKSGSNVLPVQISTLHHRNTTARVYKKPRPQQLCCMASEQPSTSQEAATTSYEERSMLQRAGQNFNSAGIALFLRMWWNQRHLAMPHLDVADIRAINWRALRAAGFKGCVFDKDNTLTAPYVGTVAPHLEESLEECKSVFGRDKLVLYSNSAGLLQFDPNGKEAEHVGSTLGVHVLRHAEKKPAGGSEELVQHFGCLASELVMIGDRYFTDVVFGNRHGMLTVCPAPITTEGEPRTVQLVRGFEKRTVDAWKAAGARPPPHALVPTREALAALQNT